MSMFPQEELPKTIFGKIKRWFRNQLRTYRLWKWNRRVMKHGLPVYRSKNPISIADELEDVYPMTKDEIARHRKKQDDWLMKEGNGWGMQKMKSLEGTIFKLKFTKGPGDKNENT